MSESLYDFFVNIEEKTLNSLDSNSVGDGKHIMQFFISKSLQTDTCGSLTVSNALENLPTFDKSKAIVEMPQRVRKRESNSPVKSRNTTKAARVDSIVSKVAVKNPPDIVEASGFQRNPDSFIGTMQSLETGEKVYTCQFCGLQGSQRGNVKKHVIVKHIPEAREEFKCETCGKEVSSKDKLKNHYIKIHNVPENMVKAAMKP